MSTLSYQEKSLYGTLIADRIELTRQTVIAIEGDKYSPSLETAFRIASVFGVGLEEVFQYEEVKKKGKR